MDDDDEFGDLYTDVLTTFADSHPSIVSSSSCAISQNPDPNHEKDNQNDLHGTSDANFTTPSRISNQIAIPKVENSEKELIQGERSLLEPNSIASDGLVSVKDEEVDEAEENEVGARVLEPPNGEFFDGTARVSEGLGIGEELENSIAKVENSDWGELEKPETDVGVADLGSDPVIPGLSGGNVVPGDVYGSNDEEDTKEAGMGDVGRTSGVGGEEDDWDSDSDDDLQIVLNDKSEQPGMDRNGGMGTDDGDGDNFLIVSDQLHQPTEEQEWGEEPAQGAVGELKEAGDAAKTNGGVVPSVGTRIGYNNHLFPSHHSQFKYVRPGAPVVPGGANAVPGGTPGQVQPPVSMGPVGRGRGDWRPMGIKTAPGMQRPFHSGFGLPAWGNNSSGRGFGSGLEFMLPSHKTAFDIEIDSFEEKPWTNPGVDVSDYFNFGLDEENWKQYCKQMEQLRLEATMQSRIRVYESGRSEQDYDPDLPPELAAATGVQDGTAENVNLANTDGGASRARPPIVPTGRAIQVESGYGERLPSIDTRPARMRDSDAIIEIVLQDSGEDGPATVEGSVNDIQRDDLRGCDDEEDIGQAEFFHHLPQPYNGRRREMVGRRDSFIGSDNNAHEEDGSFSFHPERRATSYSGGTFGTPHDGRRSQGRDRYSHQTSARDNDVIPCESVNVKRAHDEKVKSGEVSDEERHREATSPVSVDVGREPSVEQDLHNELELGDSDVAPEGEETAKDAIDPCETVQDESRIASIKRQKLSSRVEQPVAKDMSSVDSLKPTRSSDNSKARSGSSKDYLKRHDGGEEEVVQEGRSRRMEDVKKRHDEDGQNFRRKDGHGRDGRQEMDRSRLLTKGREESHISYPYRDWNPSPSHLSRVKIGDREMSRERDNSVGARQRRDDDSHGRRLKDEDMRKREHVDEIGYRHRSKVYETEKNGKDEHLHSRHRLDNGDLRPHHNKDVGLRQRDKDENFVMHHENFDDSHTRRRREEEHMRKEQPDKEVLHNYRSREDPSRKKRERDDGLDQRRREEQPRERDKSVDNHSVRHREESWRQRERDERRVKQPHEEISNREREGRNSVRSGRDLEDKSWTGNTKVKDEPKGLGSDKDYPYKDKKRASEPSKRSDRAEEDVFPQPRRRDNFYARDNQFLTMDRNPRHEKSSTHNDCPVITPDSQLSHKERSRDGKRSKYSDRIDQNTLVSSKRKQEDHNTHRSEKVGRRTASEKESGNALDTYSFVQVGRRTASEKESGNALVSTHTSSRDPGQARLSSSSSLSKKPSREYDAPQRHSSRKHREDVPSDDEKQNVRGRSKLERWTSNKDRDDMANGLSSSSKSKDTRKTYIDLPSEVNEQADEQVGTVGSVDDQHPVVEERSSHDLETKDADTELTTGSRAAEHLDTVAKLKKRSERFKTPMPTEKDVTTYKVESEATVSTQSETAAEAEVKPERPARKRRWISG